MTQETGKLADALAKAQAEFKAIKKDKVATVRMRKGENAGGTYTYNYADLSSVIDATKEALSKNGLAITQPVEFQGDRLVLHTKLLHSSGETQSCFWPLPPAHTPAQEMGSALTYARRYSMSAILGVASEDDDDGAAGNQATHTPAKAPAPAPKPAPVKQATNGKAGELYMVDPYGGEVEIFTRMSDWLTKLEERLTHSDDPLGWYDQNAGTFNAVQGKLTNSKPGLEHCKRIVDLVQEIQKAQTAPINTPDYSTAA
jgi:hypothetical protein